MAKVQIKYDKITPFGVFFIFKVISVKKSKKFRYSYAHAKHYKLKHCKNTQNYHNFQTFWGVFSYQKKKLPLKHFISLSLLSHSSQHRHSNHLRRSDICREQHAWYWSGNPNPRNSGEAD